jgi:hypothetical protein
MFNKKLEGPLPIAEEDGPFAYVYVALIDVPGLLMAADSEPKQIHSFSELGSTVSVARSCDAQLFHMDRSSAISCLLLTGYEGTRRFGQLSRYWHTASLRFFGRESVFRSGVHREMRIAKTNRLSGGANPGCYLIYEAKGSLLEPVQWDRARRFGEIGFAIDAIRGAPYRDAHRRALHGAATSLSLALSDANGSPDTRFIGDLIYLTGRTT